MENLLTDRDFWVKYWESKDGIAVNISADYLFNKELAGIISKHSVKTAIELGGFPGYYAIFLKKYFGLEVTLLDYFIHQPLIAALLERNNLKQDDIQVIEADLFNYTPQQQYDLVLSCGLIEHFTDTADIIQRHTEFLKPGGTLFITLPNFRALNGWFQKSFDRQNYDKHNISSMDPALLRSICERQGLEVIQAKFYGHFGLWLENEQQRSIPVRLLKKTIWFCGKVFTKIIPFNSRTLSPYLILEARKPK